MADPLSIASGVAGLLSLSATAYSSLSAFIAKAKNAPKSVRAIMLELSGMRLALISVSELIIAFDTVPTSRKKMIQLEYLVVVLTQSFSVLFDLRDLLTRFQAIPNSLWMRIQWAQLQSKADDIVQRLQSHKGSISLVLNILQCESDLEAQNSRATLHETMEEVLAKNKAMRLQVPQTGSGTSISEHSLSFLNDSATILMKQSVVREPIETGPSRPDRVSHEPRTSITNFRQSFECILAHTWVYSRVRDNVTDISFSSSALEYRSWSALSGLSLGDISNVSVVALPISSETVRKSVTDWYRDIYANRTLDLKAENNASVDPILLRRCRITLLGDGGVGKSSLSTQVCYGTFSSRGDYTIQDSYILDISVDGLSSTLEIVDTSGQEEYRILLQDAIRDGEGFLILFSMNRRESLIHAKSLFNLVKTIKGYSECDESPAVLVGNKSDLEDMRGVMPSHICDTSKQLGCKLFKCSAKTGENIHEPFHEVVRTVRKLRIVNGSS